MAGREGFPRRLTVAAATSDPERFTAAVAKAHLKGLFVIDRLRNQRSATAVWACCICARDGVPVAPPVAREEMEPMYGPARRRCRRVGDVVETSEWTASRALSGWGRADPALP